MAQRRRSEASKARRKLDTQEKQTNTRAKYGAKMKPSPVIVKTLDGDVLRVADQSEFVPQPRRPRAKRARFRPAKKRDKSMARIDRVSAALDRELNDALAKDSM